MQGCYAIIAGPGDSPVHNIRHLDSDSVSSGSSAFSPEDSDHMSAVSPPPSLEYYAFLKGRSPPRHFITGTRGHLGKEEWVLTIPLPKKFREAQVVTAALPCLPSALRCPMKHPELSRRGKMGACRELQLGSVPKTQLLSPLPFPSL